MVKKDWKRDSLIVQVYQYIQQQEMVHAGDRVLVGVSGGADSVCLLWVLKELSKVLDISLYAVTVHHGIRGEAADEDVHFVSTLCEALDIPLWITHVDVPGHVEKTGYSEEEAGRLLRYQSFEQIGSEQNCSVLAVAHHKDDQCETILHHLIRGSSLKGLSGMSPVRKHGQMQLIRPLLCLDRRAIEAWLRERGQVWCTDETNSDLTYTRNYIRRKLIPELASMGNVQVTDHIVQTADDIREAQVYIENQASKWLDEKQDKKVLEQGMGVALPVEELMELPAVLRREVLLQGIRSIRQGELPQNIGRVHLEQMISLCTGDHGRWIRIPGNLCVSRNYGTLQIAEYLESVTVEQNGEKKSMTINLTREIVIHVEDVALMQGLSFELRPYEDEKIWQNPYTKCFDCGKLKAVLFLRTRQSGDYIILENGGKKSLKTYMIDQKIPAKERSSIPVLADGHHVWWIGNGRVSADTKLSSDTRQVLILRKTV